MTGFDSKRAAAAGKNDWRCSHGWLRGEQCEICNAPKPAQEDEEVCSHCGSYCHERDELDKAEREIVRLQKLVAQEPVGQTICNTCNGTGVVRNLHDWTTGKKREQKCWNCHAPAAQPAQEPVALVIDGALVKSALPEKYTGHLYTTPPKREWVGLTPEETSGFTQHEMTVVKYVSKVLQEKNNG